MAFTRPVIQVAGIIDRREAELVAECGATHLGFPLRLPVNREDLTEGEAAEVIRSLPASVAAVLITYLATADETVALCDRLGCRVVQLHGAFSRPELERLRRLAPGLAVIRSLVTGRHAPEELAARVRDLAPLVDAFITDSFDPASGAEGATGLAHDWEIDRRLAECSPLPLIMAGGLGPDNVAAAIRAVRPAGVDAHSRLEDREGRKDRGKVAAFVRAAREEFARLALN